MRYNLHNVAAHFSRAAISYDSVAALQHGHLAELVSRLDVCGHVADIGCGTGMLARLAADAGRGWQVTGVDMAAGMCRIAAPHQARTVQADMHALPVADARVDASICAFALQWSNAPAQAIAELVRITKPGGTIALLTFLDGTLLELQAACEHAGVQARTNQFYSAEEYEAWLQAAGVRVLSQARQVQQTHYANARELFRSLKQMGATNSQQHRGRGLGGRAEMAAICHAYEQLAEAKGCIRASWHVGCWVLTK